MAQVEARTDIDYRAVAAGIELIKRANRAIEDRKHTDQMGAFWSGDRAGAFEPIPTYVGTRGRARLYATEDGAAYAVHTYTFQGVALHAPIVRKGLDAALRAGERLANSDVQSGGTGA